MGPNAARAAEMGPVWLEEFEVQAAYHRHVAQLLLEAERIVASSTRRADESADPAEARSLAERSVVVAEPAREQ